MTRFLCCFLLTAAALLGDVSGKWSGSFDITGPDGQTTANNAYLNLKQSGGDLTGTGGPNEEHQFAISHGKIDGDNLLTFELKAEDGPSLSFELRLENEHMLGNAKGAIQGMNITATVNLTRVP